MNFLGQMQRGLHGSACCRFDSCPVGKPIGSSTGEQRNETSLRFLLPRLFIGREHGEGEEEGEVTAEHTKHAE